MSFLIFGNESSINCIRPDMNIHVINPGTTSACLIEALCFASYGYRFKYSYSSSSDLVSVNSFNAGKRHFNEVLF